MDVKQEEVDNYCGRVPVDRLVLACHGIGQKLAVSNIAHDAACMRLLMRQLSQVGMQPPAPAPSPPTLFPAPQFVLAYAKEELGITMSSPSSPKLLQKTYAFPFPFFFR